MKYFVVGASIGLLLCITIWFSRVTSRVASEPLSSPVAAVSSSEESVSISIHTTSSEEAVSMASSSSSFVWPINRALERVTKKPFGLKVSPSNSPVQPERFSGYHTGVDFEVFPEEQGTNISISALCDGRILAKRTATGYGGLLVQACRLEDEAVTVVYGHLRLSSISVRTGDTLKAGEIFAVLGTGESAETSGERKHLHLGIHRGSSQNILGYVTREPELKNWLDVRSLSSVLQPAP